MIKLIVEDYCHSCQGFEPDLEHVPIRELPVQSNKTITLVTRVY